MATIIVYPNENSSDFELGFFDGTTVTSKNIFTGAGNSSSPQYFAHLGNKLIFEATDATGRELWITDGTAAGTHQVKDINPSGDAFSDGGIPITSLDQIHDETPAVLNGLAFFGASDGTGAGAHGREPWVTDGTNGPGTHMLMDIRPGTTGSGAHDFVAFGSFVYFIANDGTHDEVWKTDGTTTSKVTTLSGGATSGPEFGSLTVSGSNLFFVYNDGAPSASRTLYVLDNTPAGAHQVPISPAIPDGGTVITNQPPVHMTDVNGTLYFAQYDTQHGNELWKSDGATATFIKNIGTGDVPALPAFNDGNPSDFVAFNGKVYFVANDGTAHGTELWKTDGTDAGTVRVTDINTSVGVNGGNSFFFPQQLVVSNNTLYFAAIDNTNDFELYKLSTAEVLTKIDVVPGGVSSTPFALLDVGGNLYFAATPSGGGHSLYKYDGTAFTPVATDYTTATFVGNASYERFAAITGPTLTGTMNLASATEHVALPGGTPVATFTDSDLTAVAGDFTATINWGDGVTDSATIVGSNGSFSVQGSHIYADEGNFTGLVVFTHISDSATATVTGSIAVAENDHLTAHPATISAVTGSAFTGTVATFDDTDHVTPASDFTAIIDWGDGVTTAGTVSGSNGAFAVSGTHTYSTTGSKTLTVVLTDDAPGTATATASGAANVSPPNVPPVAQNGSVSGNEDTPIGGQASATDSDNGPAQIAYSLVGVDGGALHGTVSMDTHGAFTYTPAANYNGPDSFKFKANDGAADSNTATESVTVNAVNDAPVFANIGGAAHTSATEQTFVRIDGVVTVSDVELDAANGGAGNYAGASVIIGRNVAANPEDTFFFGGAGMTFGVDNVNHVLLSGGQQFATFSIPSSGSLAGTIAVNFNSLNTIATTALVDNVLQHITYENQSDTPPASVTLHWTFNDGNSGGLQGSGGNKSDTANRVVDITPVNDPPTITSDGGGDTASLSIPENTVAVTTVVATDPDSSPLTYSIVGGPDGAKFQIDAATGAVAFIAAPNFEAPADSDHNNSYLVNVRASDGSLSDDQAITVQVTDVPEVLHWLKSVDAGAHPGSSGAAEFRGSGDTLVDRWLPDGIGDFNGDGTSDLAWYDAALRDIDIWKLSNGAWAGSADAGAHPAGYQPAGFGDFNGDGTSDVLWYNASTRDLDLWKISNGQWAGSVDIGSHPAGYSPALTGDFNGDGTSDVLWYNASTRDADLWKISNGQWAGSIDIGTHPAGYTPALAGDFNGDGTSDIAWYNPTTNDIDIWKISNGQWAGSLSVGSHPAGWQPLGAADFNTDGTSDIAWYNPATNDIDIWLIKNGQWAGSVDIGTHPAGWTAVGVGDFDHNGVGDIAWFNPATGHVENWLLAYS